MHTSDALVVSVIDGHISEVVFDGELRQADWIEEGDDRAEWSDWYNIIGALPDLENHATLGCIEFDLLPRAWASVGEVAIEVTMVETGGRGIRTRVLVWSDDAWRTHWLSEKHDDRAHALLECLEAAP